MTNDFTPIILNNKQDSLILKRDSGLIIELVATFFPCPFMNNEISGSIDLYALVHEKDKPVKVVTYEYQHEKSIKAMGFTGIEDYIENGRIGLLKYVRPHEIFKLTNNLKNKISLNNISNISAAERAATQLTLGKLIARLKQFDPNLLITGFGEAHSYKSFYRDLSFEKTKQKESVESLINRFESLIGKSFYNGGAYYTMHEDTPLWISPFDCHGEKLIAINDFGCLETKL